MANLKKNPLRLLVSLAVSMSGLPAYGEVIPTTEVVSTGGAEFFVGRELGRPLVTVSLLSGVQHPGVYHVPVQTNLPQLIAFAGGTNSTSEVTEIRIRRTDSQSTRLLKYDLNHVVTGDEGLPTLQDKDLIQIPSSASLDSTLRWTAFIAGIASIALSVSLVNQIAHHP